MKKCLLIAAGLVFLSIGLFSQIPNAGFENWTTVSIDKPSGWQFIMGKVSKVTPGYQSDYAVKLQVDTNMQSPGVVMYGFSDNGEDFTGGIPFVGRPDSLYGYFKYNIQAGDSAAILLMLKKNGNPIAMNWFTIKGAHETDFQRLGFKIQYSNTIEFPDTLILGIASTLNETEHNKGYLIVDDISLHDVDFMIPNSDFEQWETSSYDNPEGWMSINYEAFFRGLPIPLTKTTDSHSGNSAALLQNYIVGKDTIFGIMSTGDFRNSWANPSFKVEMKPVKFSGFYKFFPENGDTMLVAVQLFKNHMPIGNGGFMAWETVSEYQQFDSEINYFVQEQPDSASIFAVSFWSEDKQLVRGNSKLYLDDLSFEYEVDVPAINKPVAGFNVFPNPVSSAANIVYTLANDSKVRVELYDVTGKRVSLIADANQSKGLHILNFKKGEIATGVYNLKLTTDNKTFNKRILID